jgi:transcriptional regulator with XRE-family HTH domain
MAQQTTTGDELTTGQRVARARRRKGWTQADLAAAVDRSASWVAKVEGGHAPLDRRSVLDRLAAALGVEPVELTGQPYRPASPEMDSGHSAVPALRLALQRACLPSLAALDHAPPAIEDMRARIERAEQLRQAANFSPLADLLPPLIEDLVVARRQMIGTEADAAAMLMVRACHIGRVMANLTGHHDLAWMALERELEAASAVGSPVVVTAAAWDLCGAWLHAGALHEARNAALAAVDRLEAHIGNGDPAVQAMWGALHLRAAVAYSRLWSDQDAWAHVEEARRVVPATGNAWQTQFNAPNLGIHEVEIAVELGRPADVQRKAAEVPVREIESGERLSHFWTCQARGLGMNNKPSEALDALLQAETIAGAHVLNRPMARELITDLLNRARRGVHPELRRMADLIGLS